MGVHKDPTANTAIGNVMREQKRKTLGPHNRHPDLFVGLLPHEAHKVAMRAWEISGRGSLLAIGAEHIKAARSEVVR